MRVYSSEEAARGTLGAPAAAVAAAASKPED